MHKGLDAKRRWLVLCVVLALAVTATACTAPTPTVAPTQPPATKAPEATKASPPTQAPTQAPQATQAAPATKAPEATKPPAATATTAPAAGTISDADLAKEADFFKGKNVDFVVPYATGGGYDNWARAIAPVMKKYAGANFVVKNVAGAGGMTGTNQLYAADPNGLTIGIINGPGVTQSQLTDAAGVKYDLAKFTYIGRLTADQRVFTVGKNSKYKSIQDMMKATDKIKMGANGVASSMFAEGALIGTALGMKMDMILGYDVSDEVDLAVVRGDLDADAGTYASKLPMIKNGDLIPVLQYGKDAIADLPNVPIVTKLPNIKPEDMQLITIALALGEVGRPIVAPPGLSPARAKFLEIALKKTLEDPDFLDVAKKQKLDVIYLSAAETAAQAKNGVGITDAEKKRLQDIIRQYTPGK